jgi:hypothetical protein
MATYRQQFASGNTGVDTNCPSCAVALPSFSSTTTQLDTLCRSLTQTYYFKVISGGSNATPILGNNIYSDAWEVSPLPAGNYVISTNAIMIVSGSAGLITSVITACGPPEPTYTQFPTSVVSNAMNVCNIPKNQVKYHDGSGSTPAQGDIVWDNSNGTGVPSNGYYRITDTTFIQILSGVAGFETLCIDL